MESENFELLHNIVKKDTIDAATFDCRSQADMLCMMVEQLEYLEKTVFIIQALLKKRKTDQFEKTKAELLESLRK